MLTWLPFILITFFCAYWAIHLWQTTTEPWHRFKRLSLLAFIWILTAFCYTPTSYNFGSDVIIQYIQWGPVKLNYIPFQQLDIEFWLNILLTVPLGGLLGWNFPKWAWPTIVLAGLVTGLCLESGQFALDWLVHIDRWVDIDDVLTNWVGVILGYGAYHLVRHVPGFKWLNN